MKKILDLIVVAIGVCAFALGFSLNNYLANKVGESKPSCTILKDQYGQPYNYKVTATGTEKRPMTRKLCEDGWGGTFNEGG